MNPFWMRLCHLSYLKDTAHLQRLYWLRLKNKCDKVLFECKVKSVFSQVSTINHVHFVHVITNNNVQLCSLYTNCNVQLYSLNMCRMHNNSIFNSGLPHSGIFSPKDTNSGTFKSLGNWGIFGVFKKTLLFLCFFSK